MWVLFNMKARHNSDLQYYFKKEYMKKRWWSSREAKAQNET